MTIVSVSELAVKFGAHAVLEGATLAIQQGARIGLVGRNGCGKSTFLKIIAGAEYPDSGEVTVRNGTVIGYLPQAPSFDDTLSVIDCVMQGASHILKLIELYENSDVESSQSANYLEQIEQLDGWTLEQQAQSLVH